MCVRGTWRQSVPKWLMVVFGTKRVLFDTGAKCIGNKWSEAAIILAPCVAKR